ncbi:MAG TPA: small ribosomal subunit Rsm22 family protein, partial [Bdellovibrionota bacterium]|nr:small ribosomal subunit Rsm22 family protein [Bdellovibrionota bacterium]
LWKDGPFNQGDARFFKDGVRELSEFFTQERGPAGGYFHSPEFRSSYLLYWLPFQAAKFVRLFSIHSGATARAWERATASGGSGELVVADLGAGPGTASFAWMLWLMHQHGWPKAKGSPKVRLEWVDLDRDILEDGRELLRAFLAAYEIPAAKVELHIHASPLHAALQSEVGGDGIVLAGNVFNELIKAGRKQRFDWLPRLLQKFRGAGFLVLEPAVAETAQFLATLRADLLEASGTTHKPGELFSPAIWGPCLHSGACPLAEGKDWCHFSVSSTVPGRWFKDFSQGLGSERQWLKFTYLWIASASDPRPAPIRTSRRVISDPLKGKAKDERTVLICAPDRPVRIRLGGKNALYRGDRIEHATQKIVGRFGEKE